MPAPRIFLNMPHYRLTAEERGQLNTAWPDAVIFEREGATDLADVDGTGYDVLVSESVPADPGRWPQLRLIQLLSAGANQLVGQRIWERKIPICTASGTYDVPIAQFITTAWLMMAHRMPEIIQFGKNRQWPNRSALAGFPVPGLTAGILGYGSIGRESARQLQALGMRIVASKRDIRAKHDTGFLGWPGTGDPEGKIPERWFAPEEIRTMLPLCDLLVVAAPRTPATTGMIGATELALMKPTARIVIVSRGGLVDETALAQALCAGQLAGAVVDCFLKEPPSADHPLFSAPNTILTPHMSGVYVGYRPVLIRLLAANLERLRTGLPLFNQTHAQHGY